MQVRCKNKRQKMQCNTNHHYNLHFQFKALDSMMKFFLFTQGYQLTWCITEVISIITQFVYEIMHCKTPNLHLQYTDSWNDSMCMWCQYLCFIMATESDKGSDSSSARFFFLVIFFKVFINKIMYTMQLCLLWWNQKKGGRTWHSKH